MTAAFLLLLLGLASAQEAPTEPPPPAPPFELTLPPIPDAVGPGAPRFPATVPLESAHGEPGLFVATPGSDLVRVLVHWSLPPWAVPDDQAGIEDLASRALFTDFTNSEAHDEIMALFGKSYSVTADAGEHGVSIEFACAPSHAQRLADALGDLLLVKVYHPQIIDAVRDSMIEGLRGPESPDAAPLRVWFKALLGQHPRARRPSGDVRALRSLRDKDLDRFFNRWMPKSRARILIVGDISQRRAERMHEALVHGARKWKAPKTKWEPREVPEGQLALLVHREGLSQARILFGFAKRGLNREQAAALRVAQAALGRPISGRLDQRLRSEAGLTYGVSEAQFYVEDLLVGYLKVSADHDRAIEAVELVRAELADFKETVDWDDVGPARRQLYAAEIEPLLTTTGTYTTFASIVRGGGTPEDLRAWIERAAQVTPAAVQSAAKAFYDERQMVVVVVGDAEVLEEPLKATGLPVKVLGRSTESEVPPPNDP